MTSTELMTTPMVAYSGMPPECQNHIESGYVPYGSTVVMNVPLDGNPVVQWLTDNKALEPLTGQTKIRLIVLGECSYS